MEAIRTLQYSVPESVKPYVQMIQPTTRFGQINPQRSTVFKMGEAKSVTSMKGKGLFGSAPPVNAFNATFCNTTITPDCLRGLYKIGNYTASGNSSESNLDEYLLAWELTYRRQQARHFRISRGVREVCRPRAVSEDFCSSARPCHKQLHIRTYQWRASHSERHELR